MKKREILVIGGNRFFGKRLVHQLIENGDSVTILNRGHHGDDFENNVRRLIGDRRDQAALLNLVKNGKWDIIYDQVCFNADEARSACEVFSDRCDRYIFTSSQAVYLSGENLHESDFIPTKHDIPLPTNQELSYAEGKRQCETVFFKQSQMPVVAVRLPIVIGPDDYTERLKFHIQKIRAVEAIYFPNLTARISFIHSADAAAGLFLLAASQFTGPINMASENPIAIGQVVAEIESVLGKKAVLRNDGERSPYGIESDWFMNVAKALNLGFNPKPIDQWLSGTIREVAG